MNSELLAKIKISKIKYQKEGFIILGLFGSNARGDNNKLSDIDILYEINPFFVKKYGGFASCSRIEKIRNELEQYFGVKIDLANKNALNEIGRKYILSEVEYV